MHVLFLHNNFPAQFGFFGQYLLKNGCNVYFGTEKKVSDNLGIKIANYKLHRDVKKGTHPYQIASERAVLNGQAAARYGIGLEKKGLQTRCNYRTFRLGTGPLYERRLARCEIYRFL